MYGLLCYWAILLLKLGLSIKVREPVPIHHIPFNELFHYVLVVENELLLVFIQDLVIFEIVPSKLLYGVVFELKFTGGLVFLFHVFRVLFDPFEDVLIDFGDFAG